MLDEYLTNSITIFEISHHFMVGLKKCGRVTTTIVKTGHAPSRILIFLKQLRAHGGCLGSERR